MKQADSITRSIEVKYGGARATEKQRNDGLWMVRWRESGKGRSTTSSSKEGAKKLAATKVRQLSSPCFFAALPVFPLLAGRVMETTVFTNSFASSGTTRSIVSFIAPGTAASFLSSGSIGSTVFAISTVSPRTRRAPPTCVSTVSDV